MLRSTEEKYGELTGKAYGKKLRKDNMIGTNTMQGAVIPHGTEVKNPSKIPLGKRRGKFNVRNGGSIILKR